MPRKKTQVEYNNFTNGFITEASPLTFPENSSLDEQNMNINRDGSRQRRFGMSWFDPVKVITEGTPLSSIGYATNSFTWTSAGNDGTENLGVLQKGRELYFFDLDATTPADGYISTLLLTSQPAGKPYDFTSAYGKLIVATGSSKIYVISWDGSFITQDIYELNLRDRFGVVDSLEIEEQPITLSKTHEYNLRNQGWFDKIKCAFDEDGNGGDAIISAPITYTNVKIGVYPSNADLIWASKFLSLHPSSNYVSNIDAFSPWELEKQYFGTTPSPKGFYILDLFNRGNSRFLKTGLTGLPTDSTSGGITSVTSFAGRIWYGIKEAGLTGGDDNSPNIGNMIFYSQATEDLSRWKSCHTRNDPTSETYNDVLASDGGYISIPEAGEIYSLHPLGSSLYVFASNGVWEIFGGDAGFSSLEQTVVKVTDIGILSSRSLVTGENNLAYWGESGIYSLSLDPTSLRGVVTNITENTIQSYYDDIPFNLKKQAKGAYDHISKQAVWLHNLEAKGSEYYFDRELVLDLNKGAFTKRLINPVTQTSGIGPYITTPLRLNRVYLGQDEEIVTVGGVTVTVGGVAVTIPIDSAEQKTKTSLMYWTADYDGTNEHFRLGGYTDFTFTDWLNIEDTASNFGVDSLAYILTGYLTGGDSSRNKIIPWITVKSVLTESDWSEDGLGIVTMEGESSCLMQAQWEWTNNILAGRWSNVQQVYRLPRFFTLDPSHIFSHDVVSTRNKVRGKGQALSLKFTSEPSKNMHLLGWGLEVEMEEEV